ncbi:MAG: MmcQ/YjbR family DNA-binding protein [Chitinophagaceae bacterium]|jgi:predicted DNA-binding protein (MmcQ/YjbR family)
MRTDANRSSKRGINSLRRDKGIKDDNDILFLLCTNVFNLDAMNIEIIRDYCLSKEDAEETLPFGPDVLVYKVKGKAFLLLALDTDELRFNVKCNPELALELREQYASVLPGYHMNKKHWNTIIFDKTISSKLIKEWIDHSYELVSKGKKK